MHSNVKLEKNATPLLRFLLIQE